jgi:hypothetical protein
MAAHAIATRQSLGWPMEPKVASLPLVWYVGYVGNMERSKPAGVGPRGRVAREGSCTTVLPKRNDATLSTVDDQRGTMQR